MTKMREQFEGWARRLPSCELIGAPERLGDEYTHDHHCVLWRCWQDSRENIEGQLPKLPVPGSGDDWYQGFAAASKAMRADCVTAIRMAGIKLKDIKNV